jgi:CheY-like chemotaxis protein
MPTALVIDDNRQTADLLCRMLNLLGILARPAYGPRAAMLALKEGMTEEEPPLDIVFLDINMPGIDGFEVLAFLRREPRLQQVPVVIVTSDDQPETAERARRSGVQNVIIKPASLESVEHVLIEANLV